MARTDIQGFIPRKFTPRLLKYYGYNYEADKGILSKKWTDKAGNKYIITPHLRYTDDGNGAPHGGYEVSMLVSRIKDKFLLIKLFSKDKTYLKPLVFNSDTKYGYNKPVMVWIDSLHADYSGAGHYDDLKLPSKNFPAKKIQGEIIRKVGAALKKAEKDLTTRINKMKDPNTLETVNIHELKNLIKEVLTEDAEYHKFFKKALDKTGKTISSMTTQEKKDFFNKIDAAWNGKGEKKTNESVWTKDQESSINKLDVEFEKLLDKKGIKRYSKQAADLWKSAGFDKKQSAILKETFGYAGKTFVFILLNKNNKLVLVKGTTNSEDAYQKIKKKYGKGTNPMLYSIDGKKLDDLSLFGFNIKDIKKYDKTADVIIESINEAVAYDKAAGKLLTKIKNEEGKFDLYYDIQDAVIGQRNKAGIEKVLKNYDVYNEYKRYLKGFDTNESINETIDIGFYKYFMSFYGKGGLYPDKKGRQVKPIQILHALEAAVKKGHKWGGGDTFDREAAANVLINKKELDPDFKHVKESAK